MHEGVNLNAGCSLERGYSQPGLVHAAGGRKTSAAGQPESLPLSKILSKRCEIGGTTGMALRFAGQGYGEVVGLG